MTTETTSVDMKDAEEHSSDDEGMETEDVEGEEKNLTDDGGLKKKILKKGSDWKKPSKGSEVHVHYVGKLEDGTVFDSSRERQEEFVFKLGMGNVIKGWDVGVATMKKGELALLICRSDYAYGKNGSPPKIPADATLYFEVELFSWIEEEDISENKDGGLLKKILTEGEGYEKPEEDAQVKVNYTLHRSNDEIVEQRSDFGFVIGNEQVIPGLDYAVRSMKKGEKARVIMKSQYVNDEKDSKRKVMIPNETLHAVVELVDIKKEKKAWEMNTDEKFQASVKAKDEGNELYKQQKYQRAIKKYKKANQFIESDQGFTDEQKKNAKKLKLPNFLNLSACDLKLKDFISAKQNCNKALEIENGNVKALFRRGQALEELVEWEASMNDFKKVEELDPDNKEVKRAITQVKKKMAEQNKKDRNIYGGMFQKFADQDQERKKKREEEKKKEKEEQKKEEEKKDPAPTSEVKEN